ncbi:GNAT family N-acetyltransferase [Streptomyces sp. NPDC055506]
MDEIGKHSAGQPGFEVQSVPHHAEAEKISVVMNGREVARLFLYYLTNEQHSASFVFCEDWFVEEGYRNHGLGKILAVEAIRRARERKCYKVVANSRFGKENVHRLLESSGYRKHGFEFRVDIDGDS